jgi:hypothetical protein
VVVTARYRRRLARKHPEYAKLARPFPITNAHARRPHACFRVAHRCDRRRWRSHDHSAEKCGMGFFANARVIYPGFLMFPPRPER